MTLPASGTLSIGDIVGEFGGSGSASLSEYYRGGGLVPNIAINNGIPTSGTISISDFYGASADTGTVDLNNHAVDSENVGGPVVALYNVLPGGTVEQQTAQGGTVQVNAATDWLVPNVGPQDYQSRFVSPNGSVTSTTHTVDVWQALSVTNLLLRVVRAGPLGPGTTNGGATVQIRKGTGSVVAQAIISMSATIL